MLKCVLPGFAALLLYATAAHAYQVEADAARSASKATVQSSADLLARQGRGGDDGAGHDAGDDNGGGRGGRGRGGDDGAGHS